MAALTQSDPLLLRFPFAGDTQLRLRPRLDMADTADFFQFCQDNSELRIERSATGELTIEMPTKYLTSKRNALLTTYLGMWNLQNGLGEISESSGGFVLPNGAVRSPDAAWISHERLATLTPEQRDGFLPLAPDFIIELRSETDRLPALQAKMAEWRESGVRLGLLLDPTTRTVHLYRPDAEPLVLTDPETIDCAPELPGFTLNTRLIFDVTL
nr:Uma2 family endonuclease [Armatimonas sp.]